ncbi:PREDICTED: hematopoietic prostaglandin D synthase-like [Branchiostoma belcheri]|uniref:glutathione transferase n=1 Tax=Branchiostoma belcheri TaxID=7741 RepID=A0A6P5A6J2_BRABE|nr:PREDICTED: hematopoietic prostaglandin D synthase-like [Branchiostoma belcheri]
MSSYKLTYFNGRGRAETTRLLFAAGGIKYEDVRIEGAQWPALKPNTPFGHLPILEVDGVTLSESATIARFVAKRAGLAGEGDVQQARADMVVDAVRDVFGKVAAAFFEKDETKKGELIKELAENTLPTFLNNVEKLANPSGYFVGDSLTWSDIEFYYVLEAAGGMCPGDHLKDKPNLTKVVTNVKTNPGIAKWLEERPQTTF